MLGILEMAKQQLLQTAREDGVYVDFTMGRGRDTVFLARLAPKGRVFAFDIQPEALESTRQLLQQEGLSNVTLVLDSHDRVDAYLQGPIDGGLFNLGYLPGGDQSRTTRLESTLCAVKKAVAMLAPGGSLGIAVYPGHAEGQREGQALGQYLAALPKRRFDCFLYRLVNLPEAPFLFLVQRRVKDLKK